MKTGRFYKTENDAAPIDFLIVYLFSNITLKIGTFSYCRTSFKKYFENGLCLVNITHCSAFNIEFAFGIQIGIFIYLFVRSAIILHENKRTYVLSGEYSCVAYEQDKVGQTG